MAVNTAALGPVAVGTSAAGLLGNTSPKGNADYFLKIAGIQGSASDEQHKNDIELLSWSFGASQQGTFATGGPGGGAGRVSMQDFNFTMHVDQAAPKLLLACANGEHISSAVLSARKAGKGQQEYMKVTLSNVMVSGFNILGDGSVLPVAQVTLNFAKIEVEYKEQKTDGSLGGVTKIGYDLQKNQQV